MNKQKFDKISLIVKKHIELLGVNLKKDYRVIKGKKYKNIENKSNNFFVAALGFEPIFYSVFSRSFDSSLGNTVETIIKEIAELPEIGFKVSKGVDGKISKETINKIAELLEIYKNTKKEQKVSINDLNEIQQIVFDTEGEEKFHNSDYLLEKRTQDILYLYLIELKLGGDLDNKKSRSEKEAILEQYAILSKKYENEIKNGTVKIKLFFSTAYNKDSLYEGKENWKQASVKSFFSEDELLIGKELWNFITMEENGFEIIKNIFEEHLQVIIQTMEEIKTDIIEYQNNNN